jgi:hypothetical protein
VEIEDLHQFQRIGGFPPLAKVFLEGLLSIYFPRVRLVVSS